MMMNLFQNFFLQDIYHYLQASIKLQSWVKVVGTVMQCNHNFLLCLGALIKQCNFFKLCLSDLPPPTLYNVKTLKTFWI